jgi:hypothetical protein
MNGDEPMIASLMRRYIDLLNENNNGLDINTVAAKLNFQPTTKQDLTYRPHGQPVNAETVDDMKPFTYAEVAEPFTLKTVNSRGGETTQPVEPGMIILSGPTGDKYHNKSIQKFRQNYPMDKGNGAVGPDTSEQRLVAQYPKTMPEMEMDVSYGGTATLRPGDYLVVDQHGTNPKSKYYQVGIHEFERTYNVPGR